ncbi:MAG: hypothetical protein M1814_005534 [Vezdaea aestivalis]|nr:MAG: hypothetical protein M1814_005534 [Vezdaea aestivalis]
MAAAVFFTTASALQLNWYNDHNCGEYKDSTYFSGRGIHGNEVNGQPSSAGSALFVTTNGCSIYACNSATGGCSKVKPYQCFSFPEGTYASSDC